MLNFFADDFVTNKSDNAASQTPIMSKTGRNTGWWENVRNNFSGVRFKKTYRISRVSFRYILDCIEHILARQTLTEDPISPEERLAICLYRLERGGYHYTITEMVGRGVSTVSSIVEEVSKVLVNHLWND